MKIWVYTYCLFFFAIQSYAQQGYDTMNVYFPINIASLNDPARQQADDAIKLIGEQPILIYGYADYLGNEPANMELAINRANNVKNYFLTKKIKVSQILICEGIGEVKRNNIDPKNGMPEDRKVAVFIKKQVGESNKILVKQKRSKILVSEINPSGELVLLNNVSKRTKSSTQISEKKLPTTNVSKVVSSLKVPVSSRFEELSELKPNEVMRIENIQFQPTRHYILKESEPILGELLKTLLDYPSLRIRIEGHVCCIKGDGDALDTDTYELKLSENRARFIYEYLVQYGIDSKRLEYIGFGKRKPIVAIERTQEDAQKNRRVEFRVLSN